MGIRLEHAALRGGYRTFKITERGPGKLQSDFFMTIDVSTNLDPANGEKLEFLIRFAEALARSLATEDNERELMSPPDHKDRE